MDNARKLIYGVVAAFIVILAVWLAFVFISGCGWSLDCGKAFPAERTPIPTLIPATLPVAQPGEGGGAAQGAKCSVNGVDLIGAWVAAGSPEEDAFNFTDLNGAACQGTFSEDVKPLFTEANLWYPGALACSSCHGSDVEIASARLSLSSYAGIVAGSQRASAEAKGNDILGGGNWEEATLYDVLYTSRTMPMGRPADSPPEGPVVFAGSPEAAP
ncbi:MAG: hypothetical protein GXP40_13365 [Chloroflexi bacterium]|nr:hypothetical protein [Chloroflexota bacterium]